MEILKGAVKGYDLEFTQLQAPREVAKCERVGAGRYNMAEVADQEELKAFFGASLEEFLSESRRIALKPNMNEFGSVGTSGNVPGAFYLNVAFKMRSGAIVNQQRYYDRRMRRVEKKL